MNDLFIPASEFRHFPKYGEREKWDALPAATRAKWIARAEEYMDCDWPMMKMDNYMLYCSKGEFYTHWLAFTKKRCQLGVFFIAECIEGKGRFIQQVINGVYSICEATTWSAPVDAFCDDGGVPIEEYYIVDLATSETASLLAWICGLMGEKLDALSKRVCRRIQKEIEKRVIKPYTAIDDYWWMGFTNDRINNWNPWCNMNIIMCHLNIDFGKDERQKAFSRLLQSLDRYIDTYSPDGGCDEGPMYWGAAGGGLNICLELLREASHGVADIFGEEKVKAIGAYFYKVFIDGKYFVDYADGDALVPVVSIVYSYGKNIGDEKLAALGASAPQMVIDEKNWFFAYQYLTDIFTEAERAEAHASAPYLRDAYLGHIQVMTARENSGGANGFYLSAKAGSNIESHNHNDVGNFIVYYDGKPLLIDLGTEEYRAQTFSKQRFELWYLQSQYHNCPTINGVMQHDGREYRAANVQYECGDGRAALSMELREAYPREAGVRSWRRECELLRKPEGMIVITDTFDLEKTDGRTQIHFMTAEKPEIREDMVLIPCVGTLCGLTYDARAQSAAAEEIEITDIRLERNWGKRVYRVTLTEKEPVAQGTRKTVIKRLK